MQTKTHSIPAPIIHLVETLRRLLCDAGFLARHRVRAEDFTRHRQLTFPVVMLFVLQKTVKSIQRHLQEFLDQLAGGTVFEPVTSGAWTHARAKLKHTAFIELNETAVVPMVYAPERQAQVRRWRGRRLLGVDGCLVRLPNSGALREAFGVVDVSNQSGRTGTQYPEGRFLVLYDLLNRVGLSARLESSQVGEVDLAIAQLRQAQPGDVIINDRGFTGYVYLAWHRFLGLDYIARCSTASFAAAQELFRKNRGNRSIVVRLLAPPAERAALQRLGLPLELQVRFVSLRLPNGQLEVLATSLLDEAQYPTEEFLTVYHWRWGHETFHLMMKGRLDLENFSGETVEAVRQDFFATLLLCNLESVLTEPAAETLQAQSAEDQHPKQINRAGAYHALKDQLLDLLYSQTPAEQVVAKLQRLFLAEPVSVRLERKPLRRKFSLSRSYHFQRRVKKVVF
jgi:hypothetical protein